ncbi:cob(I)yrinic acid a,c-diamide adenosyltransferase [Neptunomonas concharum]|uniref:Corrinoid adenosyltransferase n=1 Tax=Neptunomonas concharum TaxID=1031538 RepID=A0A5P1RCN6_9GAMM|nr:cob(I)yrinic acid a,c-diamide adenosyltransferase [Neptunomonas concharum]QEQ97434.1 cob(I)yrinic acid a,c-diamide adenosyltransferase [Neptunomonas concharum]
MANRLTRIYTRSGDKGTTGLADGSRISKTSDRIEALGDIDELNAVLGVLLQHIKQDDALITLLSLIQNDLFDLGGELAMASEEYQAIDQSMIDHLETELDKLNANLPPLTEFILPGGNLAAAYCHQARTLCRRAERQLIRLHEQQPQNLLSISYLNRLSDLLFVCARTLARQDGQAEVYWQPRHKR